jgi:hypothetical protein
MNTFRTTVRTLGLHWLVSSNPPTSAQRSCAGHARVI